MYQAKHFLGSTKEGSSQVMNYYFVDSDNHRTHPPLLVTTAQEHDTFHSVSDAATELAFMEKLKFRKEIAAALRSLHVLPVQPFTGKPLEPVEDEVGPTGGESPTGEAGDGWPD